MNSTRFNVFSKSFSIVRSGKVRLLNRLYQATAQQARAALLFGFAATCGAQQTTTAPAPTPWAITSRSANSRIWERTTYEVSPSGQAIPHEHHYTELATGLCYQQPGGDGQWLDSQEEINILTDGSASATDGQHQVYFPIDLYDGVITLITPDGVKMQSQPVGLCYDDGTNVALIGSLTNSVGLLASSNVVIYPDAFTGIDADLRYTYRKSGFEQEVVLNRQLPPPEAFGLDSASANLEMITRFAAPEPTQSASVSGPNGLSDAILSFGSMKMIMGKAFSIGGSGLGNSAPGAIRVFKQWAHVGNETLLLEALPFEQIAPNLSRLPAASGAIKIRRTPVRKTLMASVLPPTHARQAVAHRARMASSSWHYRSGVVMDYQEVLGDYTNVTFQSDQTYYISANVYLFGSNVFEGGSVLKYAPSGPWTFYPTGPSIELEGTNQVDWRASDYLPVIFTAVDDETVGEHISASTGVPNGYYGDPMLQTSPGQVQTISNFRISWAELGISIDNSTMNFYNGQFVNCLNGITGEYTETYLGNVLFANVVTNFEEFGNANIVAQNVTFSHSACLWGQSAATVFTFGLTNCIFANVSNFDSYAASATNIVGDYNGSFGSPWDGAGVYPMPGGVYPFETVGGGSCYLTNGCAFRGAGTPNIGPALLADLAQRTTWPPFVFSNVVFSVATNLGPQAARENTNAPDLGYAYNPIDYVFGGCDLDSNLTVAAGTAIGWFQGYGRAFGGGEPYSVSLDDAAVWSLNGTATQPCYYANYAMVQESAGGAWTNSGNEGSVVLNGGGTATLPEISANFTKWTYYSAQGVLRDATEGGNGFFRNCEFYNMAMSSYNIPNLAFTNCLFFRDNYNFWTSPNLSFVNCTFYNGCLTMYRSNPVLWNIENSAFDGTLFEWSDIYLGTNHTSIDYNAYNSNNLSWTNYPYGSGTRSGTLETNGPNTVTVSNFEWAASWFGNFYQPSNSATFHAGSTNANFLGLYHFTTRTNQAIEGTNIVTIGCHYVATDANGNPLDSNGDGIPDYQEDPLGNGLPYDGTNWALAILTQPADLTVTQGFNGTFTVTAGGVPSLSYHWYQGGTLLSDAGDVSGSASPALHLDAVQPDLGGDYYVVVTNSFGSITSRQAVLTVKPSQAYETYPLYIMPSDAYWNVTDISDPAQPVNIGELQAPFSKTNYFSFVLSGVPPNNALWHTERKPTVSEAYGTTIVGGTYGKGTVFKIGLAGLPEGEYPNELAVCGSTLYGTTAGFGQNILNATNGYGTVFSVNTGGSEFTNLLVLNPNLNAVNAGPEGVEPNAGLVVLGNVAYGTTPYGGDDGFGTVFSFNLTNGGLTNLHQFAGQNISGGVYDGANPESKLVLNSNTLYGVTSTGGSNGFGTVFEINTDESGYQILYDFLGGRKSDGEGPQAALLLSGGVLYGTTMDGGAYSLGTAFSVDLNNGNRYSILHSFDDGDGTYPVASLVISNDVLYGTTSSGGTNGGGTVFSIDLNNTNNFKVLHAFNPSNTNDAASPYATLVLASNMLYGTASIGGNSSSPGYGAVFSVNLAGNYYTNLYSFQNGSDGAYPGAGLVLSSNILFGVTDGNPDLAGDPNYGTIFRINTDGTGFTVINSFSTSSYTVLYNFGSLPNADDGAYPYSQLTMSGSAFYGIPTTLYGTTSAGGTNGYGTVFKLKTDGSGFTNLYDFTGCNDGKFPRTGLLIDGNTLYGTTSNSIFKIDTDGNDFTCLTNNIVGASQLILSLSGDTLYGTISNGGSYGYGSVFGIRTGGGGLTNIWSFKGGTNGQFPVSGLELYSDDYPVQHPGSTVCTLYGTTYSGGASSNGMVFSVNTDGSGFLDLHDFGWTNDGANPIGGLLITNNNSEVIPTAYLYGTTSSGGTNGGGTIFGMSLDGSDFFPLYSFSNTPAGDSPEGKLVYVRPRLYGTTTSGGANTNGIVFSMNSDGTGFNDLYDFGWGSGGRFPLAGLTLPVVDDPTSIWSLETTINVSAGILNNLSYSIAIDDYCTLFINGVLSNFTNKTYGAAWSPPSPMPNLHSGENDIRAIISGDENVNEYFAMEILSASTNLTYGTTYGGGTNGNGFGTIFELAPGGSETVLYYFSSAPDGQNPVGDLLLSNRMLYGVTENGGTGGVGTIFSYNIGNSNYHLIYSFGGAPNDGANPAAGLVLINNGLYGTTTNGGANGAGTVFCIGTNGNGHLLYSFGGLPGAADGAYPYAGLIPSSDAKTLYGTTDGGGSNSDGTIFSIGTNGDFKVLYNFGSWAGAYDGANPEAGLVLSGGVLYGTTVNGGTNSFGTVFSYEIGTSNFQSLYDFTNGSDGANPEAGLLLVGNTLYGTTYNGGDNGQGTAFCIGIDGGYTNLLSLDQGNYGYGAYPKGKLQLSDGSLYGTTSGGGAVGNGMVFSINVGTNGTIFNDIYDFRRTNGLDPEGGLCFP